jgi:protein-S-isoprenylcysteine O-methyltransferase Ste14
VIDERPGPAHPGVRVPPPLLFFAALFLGVALDRWIYPIHFAGDEVERTPFVALGWLAVICGFAIIAWGMTTFRRARTAIMPFRSARTIVASGPYRFSRNPMYLGFAVAHAGFAFVFGTAWPLILLPLVLTALWFLVIRREERYLAHAFGDEYARYQQRVRRWI